MTSVVASVAPSYIETVGGQSVRMTLSVANTSDVIDAYSMRVYGLDATWVTAEPARLSLFPGDIGQVTLDGTLRDGEPLSFQLIDQFPAGHTRGFCRQQAKNLPLSRQCVMLGRLGHYASFAKNSTSCSKA